MVRIFSALFFIMVVATRTFAADFIPSQPPPLPSIAAGTAQPALARIVGYVAYSECNPIADSPKVFINTEVNSDQRKFYVSSEQCGLLATILNCNGLRYGIVADVITTPDWAGFPKRSIVNILQLGDRSTNPSCLPAPPPMLERRPIR